MGQVVADWRHRGLIDADLAARLGRRYDRSGFELSTLLRWVGILAIVHLALGILALIGLVSGSPLLAGLLLGGASAGAWFKGGQLVRADRSRCTTGSTLICVGLYGVLGAQILLLMALDAEEPDALLPLALLVTGAASLATAYRFRLRWPLGLGLLLLFHGLGGFADYLGSGTYVISLSQPRLLALFGAAAAALGVWHGRSLEEARRRDLAGFGNVYVIFGLLYLNLSLWILTLPGPEPAWVLLFTVAAVGQIVTGARLHDGRFSGFGIVFLAIDLYTRFFEHFWDALSAGSFLLLGGLAALALGWAFERHGVLARQRAQRAGETP